MPVPASLGRPDRPLQSHREDRLSIRPYAAGLASFVQSAETPMTIGIQGEWGSGKTSLMQLVLKQVEKDSKDTILTHWFETWQYGASGGGDSLGLLLMRDLCFSLVERVKDERWQEKLREETFGFLKKMETDGVIDSTMCETLIGKLPLFDTVEEQVKFYDENMDIKHIEQTYIKPRIQQHKKDMKPKKEKRPRQKKEEVLQE